MSALPPPVGFPVGTVPEAPAGTIVSIEHVSKVFGDVVAISDVSAWIGPGVTALLGPNGAGKSTLFRVMCGLTPPSQGRITVLGTNVRDDIAVRGRIGLVPQQDALFDRLTGTEFVELAARTQAVKAPEAAAAAAIAKVGLTDAADRAVGKYSKGMRQRTKIAAAIVNEPEVMILDEPLNGLDPLQRRRLTALFHDLADGGRCVIVSSHVLEEVARLGSRVLIIAQGRLAATGDYRELRAMMDDRPQRIRVGVSDPRRVAAQLVATGLVRGVTVDGDSLTIETDEVDRVQAHIAPITRDLGVRLTELRPLDDDLESVFRYLVERS